MGKKRWWKRREKVKHYFSPNRGAIDIVCGFIDRVEHTIDVAVYAFTHDRVAETLIKAVLEREIEARVITDHLQASSRYADDEKLVAAGIPLIRDRRSGSMHHKYAISDAGKRRKRAVLTGSLNWTASADERNRENFVIIRDAKTVAGYQANFDEMWDALL